MSLTLGEKLRQAREERGFTLSEVADQTRISSSYLESIENDDYRILPGGIFNKGFVKSYAKLVGLNEQEALADYSSLLAESEANQTEDVKVYRPEVLTDDRSGSSMMPTIIVAVIILALMTIGILYGLSYLRETSEPSVANTRTNTAVPAEINANATGDIDSSRVPTMATIKVEFSAVSQPVSLTAVNDGKSSSSVVTPGTSSVFEPRETLRLSYSRSLAAFVQMTINGKPITLPTVPLNARRNVIDFEINKDNLERIWSSGAVSTEPSSALPDTGTANSAPASAAPVRTAQAPRPTPANTPAARTPPPRAPASPRPPVATPGTAGNRP